MVGEVLGRSAIGGRQDQHHTVLETDFGGLQRFRVLSSQFKEVLVEYIDNHRAVDRRDTEVHFRFGWLEKTDFGW